MWAGDLVRSSISQIRKVSNNGANTERGDRRMMEEGNHLPFGGIHKQQYSLWIVETAAWKIIISTKLLA